MSSTVNALVFSPPAGEYPRIIRIYLANYTSDIGVKYTIDGYTEPSISPPVGFDYDPDKGIVLNIPQITIKAKIYSRSTLEDLRDIRSETYKYSPVDTSIPRILSTYKIVNEIDQANPNVDSRYQYCKSKLTNQSTLYLSNHSISEIPSAEDDGYHIVELHEENRLDILANLYYQNATLYWVIAKANQIKNPLSVPAGCILRIPSKNTLWSYNGVFAK